MCFLTIGWFTVLSNSEDTFFAAESTLVAMSSTALLKLLWRVKGGGREGTQQNNHDFGPRPYSPPRKECK